MTDVNPMGQSQARELDSAVYELEFISKVQQDPHKYVDAIMHSDGHSTVVDGTALSEADQAILHSLPLRRFRPVDIEAVSTQLGVDLAYKSAH